MKKVLMLVTDGVEEIEALSARDVFLRAGLDVEMMNIDDRFEILSSHQLLIKVVPFHKGFDKYDALYIPGGKRGVQNLDNFILLDEVIKAFLEGEKLVASICAGPSLLGKRGYLKDRHFTCYPGWEVGYDGEYTGAETCEDGNLLTGRSMYFTNDFALLVIKKLLGEEETLRIANQIKGIK